MPGRARRGVRSRSQHLTVSLIQREYTGPDDALTPEALATVDRLRLRRSLPYRAVVYVQRQQRREPGWVPFLNTGLTEPLTGIRNASSSAVLIIQRSGHLFAISFGFGRFLLREDRVERDFGLRVVLNTVDPESLRSVDLRTLDETTLITKRQASKGSTIEVFGVDVSRDMLRAVTGTPANLAFARSVTGADRVAFTAALEIDQLGAKCDELLSAYSSVSYREWYPWVDNLRVVRERALIVALDGELVARLAGRHLQRVHLAAPEQVDWEAADGYRYSVDSPSAELREDLDIEDYLGAAAEKRPKEAVSLEHLKSDHISVLGAASEQPLYRWTVYRALVLDLEYGGATYALTDGHWYEVEQSFANTITEQVAAMEDSEVWFPDARTGEREDAYVARAAPEMSAANGLHVALMDKRLARAAGALTGVEVCDLLSELGHFIHVKKGNESATLSHLFAQGTVSAELFVADSRFRAEARAYVQGTPCDTDDLFPTTVRRDHVTVIYAIVNPRVGALAQTLPFFSRVNLVNAARRLHALGCRVQKKHIAQA